MRSRLCVASDAKLNRSASVPYAGMPCGNCLRVAFSMAGFICGCIRPVVRFANKSSSAMPSTMSSGSITLPFDLDIFCPSWSRISPCM